MKTYIKCETCENAFYCETYFNEFKKKDRTFDVLSLMCRHLGGYKKIKKEIKK